MMGHQAFDFSVYRVEKERKKNEEGAWYTANSPLPTGLIVGEIAKRKILSIPKLVNFTIYDGPYYIGSLYNFQPPERGDEYWFVHYQTKDREGLIGSGMVMVIERKTERVIYDGPDGME